MNGYVVSGYVVVLGSLSAYAVSVSSRLRAARRRAGRAMQSESEAEQA